MTSPVVAPVSESAYVFPPALVHLARERLTTQSRCLIDVPDETLELLLTTIFFAGLETYEGEHNPIGVAFMGSSRVDIVMPEGTESGAMPLYQWKVLRFATPRPFATGDLIKLAVAGADRRIFAAVGALDDGRLAITGLAREGLNVDHDPFIKIVATRPGCLSLRSGRDRVIEYERGAVLPVGAAAVFSEGPVERALATIARAAGVDDGVVRHYINTIAFLVREIVAHGRGGILIISADEHPQVPESAPYRMTRDSSLATLLRLAWRSAGAKADASRSERLAFGQLLRNAFLTETERVVEELGRLTAIDGAVLLNRDLALVAFGLILRVGAQVSVALATADDQDSDQPVEFATRGTRHRAGATYAADHPGSVVFVVSEDGRVSCLLCEQRHAVVKLWHLAAEVPRVA